MNQIRVGIIGLGNIGRYHADYLFAGKVQRCVLNAICSSSPQKLEEWGAKGLKTFNDREQLFRSGDIDAVVIATPHGQHCAPGIAAFQNGLHVMVEKPIAAHKADAERLVAAHRKHPELVFAAMFQMRAEPRYQKIRELIQGGRLGQLVRINWINTDWFRTEAYYASGGWRATWQGEGGGVLLNQSLHQLDLLGWLCGAPTRVRGFCQFGRFHQIEVEDNVTAYFEWANRTTGAFFSSTGESPGTNRLEIAGTGGKLVLEHNRLTFTRNTVDMIEFSRTARQGFAKPETTTEEIPFADAPAPHAALMQNFVDAILDGGPLLAPGKEGVHSVELANAMVYSSLLGQTVELPLDGAAWERKLNELIAGSKVAKKKGSDATNGLASSLTR
jgi:predicted dehydrogenase